MAIDLLGLLQAATGGQNPPSEAPAMPEQDIPVQGTAIPPLQRRSGLIHNGLFSLGHTGGNILGALGDAFLTQAGRAPQYEPRLQQARESEALQNFSSDPDGAMKNYLMVNPYAAMNQMNVNADNTRQQTLADSTIADQSMARQMKARNITGGMITASNAQTWPRMLAQIRRTAAANGIDPADIPDDLEGAKAWAKGSVPVGDQQRNDAMIAYRDGQQDLARQRLAETRDYHDRRVTQFDKALGLDNRKVVVSEGKPKDTPATVIGGLLAKQARGETLTPNEEAAINTYKSLRPGKATKAGPKYVVDPATGKIVISK